MVATHRASPGRLVAVVGPSGVGKDSLIAELSATAPGLTAVRRTITRAATPGDEPFEPVSEAEFARRLAAGAFCLHWRAHGLSYGIPAEVRQRVAGGADMIGNLSRDALRPAASVFERLVVLHLTARAETLAARLSGRGRESAAEIESRLARAGLALPENVATVAISNDGPLGDTVSAAMAALYPERS